MAVDPRRILELACIAIDALRIIIIFSIAFRTFLIVQILTRMTITVLIFLSFPGSMRAINFSTFSYARRDHGLAAARVDRANENRFHPVRSQS